MADDTNWTRAAAYLGIGLLLYGGLSVLARSRSGDSVDALLVAMYLHGGNSGITWEAGRSCRTGYGPEGLRLSTAEQQNCTAVIGAANNISSVTDPTERQILQIFLAGYNSTSGVNPYTP